MRNCLVFIIFLFSLSRLAAQTGFVIQGRAIDFHNNSPLTDVQIVIANQITYTQPDGSFLIRNVPKGNHTLVATHDDCDAYSQNISVDRDLVLQLPMEHHTKTIEELIIKGLSKPAGATIQKSISKTEISRNATENLSNLLTAVSGVSALKTGNNIAKPIIRGLYGSRILMYNNNVRMAEQEWGAEHAPSVDVNAFERLRVIKGAGTLKFGGDAMGGVIALEPKNFSKKDTLMGSAMLGYISSGKGINTVVEVAKTWENNWYIATQGSYRKMGDLSTPNATLQNTGLQQNALSYRVGYRGFDAGLDVSYNGILQELGIFRGAHLSLTEDFYNAVKYGNILYTGNFSHSIAAPKQMVEHHLAKAEGYRRFKDFGKFTVQYAYQLNRRKEYDIRKGEYTDLPSMDLRLTTHSAKMEHLLEREKWSIESGIQGVLQDNYPNPDTRAKRLIPDYYRYDLGVFSHVIYHINPTSKLEFGVRYDSNRYDAYKYYDQDEWNDRFVDTFSAFVLQSSGSRVLVRPQLIFNNFSANIGFSYRASDSFSFDINFARASRAPNAAELFADGLHHSAAIIERGNLGLQQEIMNQVNASVELKSTFLKGFRWELQPYYMFGNGFINQIPTATLATIRGIFPIWDYQQIEASMLGIESDLELRFTDFLKWNSQYSYVKGDDHTHHEPLILMAPMRLRNQITVEFPKFRKFYFTIENLYVAHQSRFPVRNITIDRIVDNQLSQEVLDISTPPASYNLWNISAGLDLIKNLTIGLRIQNTLNTEYREYLNRLRFFAPEMGRNITLNLQYHF